MKKKFEVSIAYVGNLVYIVEAENSQIAKDLAKQRWHNGDNGDLPNSEEETITSLYQPKEID